MIATATIGVQTSSSTLRLHSTIHSLQLHQQQQHPGQQNNRAGGAANLKYSVKTNQRASSPSRLPSSHTLPSHPHHLHYTQHSGRSHTPHLSHHIQKPRDSHHLHLHHRSHHPYHPHPLNILITASNADKTSMTTLSTPPSSSLPGPAILSIPAPPHHGLHTFLKLTSK
jgi:hypothetical protein